MIKKDIALICLVLLTVASVFILFFMFSRDRGSVAIKNGKEIERKWLINESDIPYDLSKADKYEIEQTYICFDPEIRIRHINNGERYILTIKSDMSVDGLVRDEVEYDISKESYESLLTKKEGNTISKTRYQIYEGDLLREIDIFKGDLQGLAYMETEFESEEQSKNRTPDWVIKEVTSDKKYKNQSLARYGMPQ